jgi:hypothetical protein
MYNIEKEKSKLIKIKDRYFHPDGRLCHHGDCKVYRSIEAHDTAPCTCGFLHDLRIVNENIKMKLHPTFYDELSLEDGLPRILTEEEKEEIQKLFPFLDEVVLEIDSCKDWELIEEVFGDNFRKRKELE